MRPRDPLGLALIAAVAGATFIAEVSAMRVQDAAAARHPALPVIELRQYTLLPGKRDVLIDLFEREFIEGQEDAGMRILGQFRDLDRPNRFVWIRGFSDMPTRARSLAAFYDGPVWQRHRAAANATMVDSDNVLLLRPARAGIGFTVREALRPARGATAMPSTLVAATIYSFSAPVETGFIERFERVAKPDIESAGGTVLAYFVTDDTPNNFPRLPLREGEHVFVWFAAFRDEAACAAHAARPTWQTILHDLASRAIGAPEVLRLQPTGRSLVGRS